LIAQTSFSIITSLIGILLAINIYKKDARYVLNQLFSLGAGLLAINMIFFASGNISVLLAPNADNSFVIVYTMKVFLSLLPVFLVCFLLSALVLYFGKEITLSYRTYPYIIIFLIINFIIVWGTDSVVPVGTEGNIETGVYVNFIGFPLVVLVYVLTFYFFYKVYRSMDSKDIAKANIKMFLFGWIVAGLGMLLAGLSNILSARSLDLIAPFFLVLGMFFLQRGFKTSKSKNIQQNV
jgi:hypothetical protein